MGEPFKVSLSGDVLEEADILLVLLHGHGSQANELARPAASMVSVMREAQKWAQAKVAVVLPEGPLGRDHLRTWWNMPPPSNAGAAAALAKDTKPPEDLVQRLAATVRQLLDRCGSSLPVVLGGFSQGAFLAMHGLVALRMDGVNASGLLGISGFLDAPVVRLAADIVPDMPDGEPCQPFRVFFGHGEEDEVVSEMAMHEGIAAVRAAKGKTICGLELETFFHEGGHEIGEGVAEAAGKWLQGLPPPRPRASGVEEPPAGSSSSAQRFGQAPPPPAAAAAGPGPGSLAAAAAGGEGGSGKSAAERPDAGRGGDADGEFRPGDMVRIQGLRNATHLNRARGLLEVWDEESGTWEVEVQATQDRVFVKPRNLERFVPEGERQRRAARQMLQPLSPEELAELRRASIPPLFDAPQLHRVFWGSAGAPRPDRPALPAGAEVLTIAGHPCLLFGASRRRGEAELPPTVLLFHGRCNDIAEAMSRTARAYVNSIGARVVVPVGAAKTSAILERARALVAGLPDDLQLSPLVVHGCFTGSIPAVQVAAEQSQHDVVGARCQVLVLERGISSIRHIPGVEGVIGGVQNDPFRQELKLRMTRCHIALVEGVREQGPYGKLDVVDCIARCCPTSPTIIREELSCGQTATGEELLPELKLAVLQGLSFGAMQ